jgi:hypothetical protein
LAKDSTPLSRASLPPETEFNSELPESTRTARIESNATIGSELQGSNPNCKHQTELQVSIEARSEGVHRCAIR